MSDQTDYLEDARDHSLGIHASENRRTHRDRLMRAQTSALIAIAEQLHAQNEHLLRIGVCLNDIRGALTTDEGGTIADAVAGIGASLLGAHVEAEPTCNCLKHHPNQRLMVVCPKCGNKRCPKVADCGNRCTGSSEPNQVPERDERVGKLIGYGCVGLGAFGAEMHSHTFPSIDHARVALSCWLGPKGNGRVVEVREVGEGA